MALLTNPKSLHDWYTTTCVTDANQIAQNTYNQALRYFEQELSQDNKSDLSWIYQTHSIDEVTAAAENAKSAYSAATVSSSLKRKARHWTVAFSSRIVYYGQVLDALAQHHPEYTALAWGAMKFVLQGVLNHAEILTEFAKAMSEIGDALPRIDLQARLYPGGYIQSIVSRVYAHIMLFMQQAVKWCYIGSFRRMMSSFVKPWSLSYQDTVDQIRSLITTVDANSNAAAGAELRGVSLSLTEHDKKLDDLRIEVNATLVRVSQVLDVANKNFNISQKMSFQMDDQTLRICDLQYHQILSMFRPERLPEDALHSCRAIARRRKIWTQPMLQSSNFLNSFKDWCSAAGSVLFVVRASFRAEATTKDLALEAITFFQASSFKVIWFVSERMTADQNLGMSHVLKSLIYQILHHDSSTIQNDPQNVNISKFRQLSDLELQDFLIFLLMNIPKCFIIVETESLFTQSENGKEWCRQLETVFQRVVDTVDARNNGTVKILLVTYGVPTPDVLSSPSGPTDRRLTTVVRSKRLPIAKTRMMTMMAMNGRGRKGPMHQMRQTRL